MEPTIAYFESLLAEHPGYPVLVYELAGAYDTAGQEENQEEKVRADVTDLGRWADGLRGLAHHVLRHRRGGARWLADGRPDS